jgi:hypothetical protein
LHTKLAKLSDWPAQPLVVKRPPANERATKAQASAGGSEQQGCPARDHVSIYQNPWWLNAATDGKWQLIAAGPASGFIASMPVFTRSFLGQRYIGMPPLTRTLGPTFTRVSDGAKLSDRVRFRLLSELIHKLPDAIGFRQRFDPECDDLLAFQVTGFSIGIDYTYRFANCSDTGAIWEGMRDKTRNAIRRSQDLLQVSRSLDIAQFVEFYEANLRRAGKSMTPERKRMQKILEAAVANEAGISLLCRTAGGELAAAIFIVWNDQYCHYLLSTRDERIACNGAVSLLIWNALQLAGQMNRGFDFDGFGTNGAANFLRQFGARLVPRWTLLRAPRLIRALLMSRSRFFNSEP